MAVHTLVVGEVVVTECLLLEVLHAALFNLQVVPYLIVWFDEAVGEEGVHLVLDNLPVKRTVFRPFAVFQRRHRHLNIMVVLKEFSPVVLIKAHLIAIGIHCQFSCRHLNRLDVIPDQEV